ncbi:MAG: hypothetical protein R3248_10535 [Candidatus Promineifilaceae bacterium]|nr:hypothetical protein [Candidatus Promineifilaceae bacterium]
MANQDMQTTMRAYEEAIATLYAQPAGELSERGAGEIADVPEMEARMDAVIGQSRSVREALAAGQESERAEERELAQLQLLASAAMDLHVASDMVRRAEEGVPAGVVERSATAPTAMAELHQILRATPEVGMRSLVAGEVERATGPTHPAAAKASLLEAVEGTLFDIRDEAASVGETAIKNLDELPVPAIKDGLATIAGDVLEKLGEGASLLVRKAATLVAEAIDKILQLLGKKAEDKARQQIAQWVEDLKEGTLLETLLQRLYEPDRIRQSVEESVEQAGDLGADRYNEAAEAVNELATKFRKQTGTTTWVLKGLTWASPWILGLGPQGAPILAGAYALTLGYVVFLGGDYADWFRLGEGGRLDLVPGVRTVVGEKLAAAG